jgi:hypothetical protein
MEEHLAECETCREIVATAKEFAAMIREGGEVLFEPHPRELELREHATGTAGPGSSRLERHLAACATCRLEVEAWKARDPHQGSRGDGKARAPSFSWIVPSLTAAAGVILGVGITVLLSPHPGSIRVAPAPAQISTGPQETWRGDSPLYVLPGTVRGVEETPIPTWILGKEDSRLSIGVRPSLTDEIPDAALFRLEMRPVGGGAIWSIEMTAARMREHLKTAEVVHVTLPAEPLLPGEYEFTIAPAGSPAAPPIYRARVRIAAGS